MTNNEIIAQFLNMQVIQFQNDWNWLVFTWSEVVKKLPVKYMGTYDKFNIAVSKDDKKTAQQIIVDAIKLL